MQATRCPCTSGAEILARKWALVVLRACKEPKRFGELLSELHFVTNRNLSLELHHLLAENVLAHTDETYRLTAKGTELLVAAAPLLEWGSAYAKITPCPGEGQQCSSCARFTEFYHPA